MDKELDQELERIITLISIHITKSAFDMVVDTIKELPIPEELKAAVLDQVMVILQNTITEYLFKTTVGPILDVPAERTIQ